MNIAHILNQNKRKLKEAVWFNRFSVGFCICKYLKFALFAIVNDRFQYMRSSCGEDSLEHVSGESKEKNWEIKLLIEHQNSTKESQY